jgi:hypothetical protein
MAARMSRQRPRPSQLAYGAYLIEAAACYVHGGCMVAWASGSSEESRFTDHCEHIWSRQSSLCTKAAYPSEPRYVHKIGASVYTKHQYCKAGLSGSMTEKRVSE